VSPRSRKYAAKHERHHHCKPSPSRLKRTRVPHPESPRRDRAGWARRRGRRLRWLQSAHPHADRGLRDAELSGDSSQGPTQLAQAARFTLGFVLPSHEHMSHPQPTETGI
jgi:hypothetical protein